MKKVYDRIWEWIKSTAWFQVVILVGIVVAVVLCISPITSGITAAVSEANRSKYFENNRITYSEMISKIENLDASGDEFAVYFQTALPGTSESELQKAIERYSSETEDPVKIYYLQTDVTEANKATYNSDENWYNYFKITTEQIQDISRAANNNNTNPNQNVYNWWKNQSEKGGSNEVTQTNSFNSDDTIPNGTLMWFRPSELIDPAIATFSTLATPSDPELDENFNFHIAKIYLTINYTEGEGSDVDSITQYELGLTKFFETSIVSK